MRVNKKILLILIFMAVIFLAGHLGAEPEYKLLNTEYKYLKPNIQVISIVFDRPIESLVLREVAGQSRGVPVVIFEFLNTVAVNSYRAFSLKEGEVTKVVTAQFETNPAVCRVVIDLKNPLEYEFAKEKNILKITFDASKKMLVSSPKPAASQPAAASKKIEKVSADKKIASFPSSQTKQDVPGASQTVPVAPKEPAPQKTTLPVAKPQENLPEVKATAVKSEDEEDIWSKISPDLKEKASRIVSFDFKKTSLVSIIRVFSKETGINILANEDMTGEITASFNDVPALEAFDVLLKIKGYSWYQDGSVLMVSQKKPMKVFALKYLNVTSALVGDLKKMISGDIIVDINTNSLIVRGSSEDMRRIEGALKKVDKKPQQVLVDARIIELTAGGEAKLGVNLKRSQTIGSYQAQIGMSGMAPTVDSSNPGFYAQAISSTQGIDIYLSALQARKDYNILASPKILTLNHEPAELLIGSKIGYKRSTTTSSGGSQQVSDTIDFLEVGTKLKFTPHIGEDSNLIIMEVHPEVSEGEIATQTGIPTKHTTETTVKILVKDGQTLVIGGLMKESAEKRVTGVPILMHLPIIGMLFSRTEAISEKREILIFLTPRIIDVEKIPNVPEELIRAEKKLRKS